MPQSISITEPTRVSSAVFKAEISEQLIQEIVPAPLELKLVEIEKDEHAYGRRVSTVSKDQKSTESVFITELPYLMASLFGTILENTLTQLRILVECNTELRILKTKSDWNDLQCMKYSVQQPTCLDELSGVNEKNLGKDEYKIKKLDMDRTFVTNVIKRTYVDLCLNKTFTPLEDNINDVVDKKKYRASLVEDEAKNKLLRHELARQLRQQRNHIKSVIYDTDIKIDELKNVVEDAVLISECQSRYIDNWQGARTEQHTQTIHNKEAVFSDSVDHFKQRTDHEQRVHLEIEMLTNIAINETLQKVEDLMTKYDKDMEAMDLKIQIKKNDYQNMKDKRIDLEETIEKHAKLIKDWVHFKEEREKARLYHEKMTKSAIIVQAWWRGLLVRCQLGPFRVVKKKGGTKKK